MKIAAIPVSQGETTFWLCKVKVKDILGKCRVDQQSPDNSEGYQREVISSRAKKFGKFMMQKGFSPVSLLVNIRNGKVNYKNGDIEISDSYDWWIVDGQHRFEGLRAVSENEEPHLRETEIPIVLMNTDKMNEAKQFLIINKLQKGVRTDLAERILLLLERKEGKESVMMQNLPVDIWKIEALRIVDLLTDTPESPLHGLIKRPGEKGWMPLKQVSVTDSLKPVIDIYKSYLPSEKLVAKALMNMWGALKEQNSECFDKPKEYLLLKTPGIFVMHKIFANLLPTLCSAKERDLTKSMFLKIFSHKAVNKFFEAYHWRGDNEDGVGKYGTGRKSYSIIITLIWDAMSKVVDDITPGSTDHINV